MPALSELEAVYPIVLAQQLQTDVTEAVQLRLDTFAQTRGYEGILSAASYATSRNPKFSAEGQYAVDARDAHWAKCYEILVEVQTGKRPLPTVEAIMAELPVLEWPL